MIAWASTFVICSIWLEVNSAGDRVIQRAVSRVAWLVSRALDYFIDLTMQGMA
jgi:hypothetical protein